MKILKKLIIGNSEKVLIQSNIILELNGCGRGFIVVKADHDEIFINKAVIINLGYHGDVQRWFTGYVESEQPAKIGTKKLMIRELIGIYGDMFNCSFQHPTIKDITSFLTDNYQLKFDLPSADYINTKIPHFKHSGSGYHLLDAIGRAFNIDNYVFYQKQTGVIYLGSYQDSYYAKHPVEYGNELNKMALSTAGSDVIKLPFMPKLRPGVNINSRRIKSVNLIDDEITVTFEMADKSIFDRQLNKSRPEISAGYHLPMFGRVEAISDLCNEGNISTPFRPRYAVDVQLLDENGCDALTPVYKGVPLPVALNGWEKGAFCYPDVGSIVDIAFAYGRADQPIIRNVYPFDMVIPAVQHGEMLIQQRPEVYARIDKVGNITRTTDQVISDITRDHIVKADYQDNTIINRKTTILADDDKSVLGNKTINAGAVLIGTVEDYAIGVGNNYYQYVKQNYTLEIGSSQSINIKQNKNETIEAQYQLSANSIMTTAKQITEQIETMRSMIAGSQIQLVAPSIWLGSNQINVSQLMIDTLDLIKQLSNLTASHTHYNTGTPTNAASISKITADASALDGKYSPIIAK